MIKHNNQYCLLLLFCATPTWYTSIALMFIYIHLFHIKMTSSHFLYILFLLLPPGPFQVYINLSISLRRFKSFYVTLLLTRSILPFDDNLFNNNNFQYTLFVYDLLTQNSSSTYSCLLIYFLYYFTKLTRKSAKY